MRIVFVSDFHGRVPDVSAWAPELVIAGGDYCEVDEIRRLKFAALQRGWAVGRWVELVGRAHAEELVDRALAEGAAVLAALSRCGVPVLAIPGNSDRIGGAFPALVDRHQPRPDRPHVAGRLANLETRLIEHEGLLFAGLGGWSGPPNPQRLESEIEQLSAERARLSAVRGHQLPLVLVSHNVPYGSSLDGVNNPEVPAFAQGKLVGSQRCHAALAALQPVLCLTGHLHENFGRTERIGSALCVCGAGAYRGDAVVIEVHPDGSFEEPQFVGSQAGAPRVLA
ncbi:MAG: metallophosphoesterase family protein [Planctomycetota bacterium]